MDFEKKYLKYKRKYLELKNNMNGGFPYKKLYYKRKNTDYVDGDFYIGQSINFNGKLYLQPLNLDLPNSNTSVGNANINYTIVNNFDKDVLVNITLQMNFKDKNYVFSLENVKILDFDVNKGYALSCVLNLLSTNTNEQPFKLQYQIDSTRRFGQHSGEFTLL